MTNHFIGADEPIIFKLTRPGVREKAALRDIFEALQPLLPLLHLLGDLAIANPNKNFELAQSGITVPLKTVAHLLTLMDRVERELLPKE